MEDECTALCERFPADEAERRAVRCLYESNGLMREISRIEEEPMTQMARAVYLPGLMLLTLYTLLAVGLGVVLSQPTGTLWKFARPTSKTVVSVPLPPPNSPAAKLTPNRAAAKLTSETIVSSPLQRPKTLLAFAIPCVLLLGAIGAGWAKANGATRAQRALVSVFPVLMPLAGFLFIGPVSALLQGRAAFPPIGDEVLPSLIKMVVIPAAGLLLGALPFLLNGQAQKNAST